MKESTNKLSTKQVSKAMATPKQSYLEIMQELGISIYGLESTQKCNYNLVKTWKAKKTGIQMQKLEHIHFIKNALTILRYYNKIWYVLFLPQNQQKQKKGVFYEENQCYYY